MFGLLDWLKIGAGFAIGAAIISLPAYYTGRGDGRDLERTAALQRSMELIRERSKTNEAIRNLGPDGLCRELGGVFEDGQCK